MNQSVHYSIKASRPQSHLFEVALEITNPHHDQTVTLPAWIPGSYLIRDFARHIISISAQMDDKDAVIKQIDKQSWCVLGNARKLVISYQVYSWDLSVRGAHLDTTHGYFNGSCVFLRPLGLDELPVSIEIFSPVVESEKSWQVATSLRPDKVDNRGFGFYSASGYEDLIDHPVEMGTHQTAQFDVQDTPHSLVINGRHNSDLDRICTDLSLICTQHAELFGELPIDRYLFLTQLTANGYGGLEHKYSTSLICRRGDLPALGETTVSDGYRRFLGLCSHEYFHLWNVKRIRPENLKNADLSTEAYTQQLWAFEGITSYYDDLALLRSQRINLQSYLQLLAQTITRVMGGSGRFKQSVADSSFNAWTKFYKQDENAANSIVSYYTKGALVAFGLDMLIRRSTDDRHSLDTVMRMLWQQFGKSNLGVPEDGIEQLVASVCGNSVTAYFEDYVYAVKELPLQDWFAELGLGYRLRPSTGHKDKGGVVTSPDEISSRLSLGGRLKQNAELVLVVQVADDGALQAAGLAAGDRIVAIDGLQLTAAELDAGFPGRNPGDVLKVHALRGDILMAFDLGLKIAPADTCELWLLADDLVSSAQLQRRMAWAS